MAGEIKIRPDEITAVLKKQLADYQNRIQETDVGTVLLIGDGIARVYGLPNVMASEILEFPHHIYGLAMNLEQDNIGCIILANLSKISTGNFMAEPKNSS